MLKDGPWMPGAGSHIPSTPKGSWTPPGCPGKLCSLTLTTGAGLGSAAGCTKRVQPRGISFRSLMTEKSLLGHTAPSPLPARAGLGTASIDFNSRSIEISSGEEWGGGAQPLRQRGFGSPAVWMGSQRDLLSGSPVAMSPLCHGGCTEVT